MRIAIWVLLIAAVLVLIYSLAAVASRCSREEEQHAELKDEVEE